MTNIDMTGDMTMMKKKLAGVLLASAVVGGVLVGFAADAMTSDAPSAAATPTPSAKPSAKTGVEVIDPVLVTNDDGTATLSATLVNQTTGALDLNDATGGLKDDLEAPSLLVFGNRSGVALEPGAPTRIGGASDDFRIRSRERVQVGSTLPVTIVFTPHEGADGGEATVTVAAPVVKRSGQYAKVANNGPNNDITLNDGIFVVVPGQAKAFIGGYITSKVTDLAEIQPRGVLKNGLEVDILHQTATGGPSGAFADPGKKVYLGQPPYLDTGGDADYVRASDVKVGQTITVTYRFPSGDVVGKFKVVQGTADGTI